MTIYLVAMLRTIVYLGLSCFVLSFGLTSCGSQPSKPDPLQAEHGKTTGIPAIDALTRDISADPDNMSLRIARLEAYTNEGLFKEAEDEARRIYEYDKTNWRAARLLAWAYFDNQKSKPALKTLEQALELYPDTIPLLLVHAEISLQVQQYNEALTSADKVLKLRPAYEEGHFMRGLVLKYMGDTVNAVESFQTAIEQDADHIDAYMQLADIASSQALPIAITYYDNALRIDSTSYEALKGKASFYHQNYDETNNYREKVAEAYERLIFQHPQEPNSCYNYGLFYMEEKDYEQAAHFFDIATKYDPTFGAAYYYRGEALERQGNYSQAKTAYENALSAAEPWDRAEAALERLERGDYLKG